MSAKQFWISLLTVAALALTSVAALAQDRTVNCNVGQSLQDAVNKARSSAAPLVLTVKGTCNEEVRFSRDLLVIDGGNEAVIHGSLVNFGARATIRNIGITGPGIGLLASSGRTRLVNVHFFDNGEEGLAIRGSGTVAFIGGSITNSGLDGIAVESGNLEVEDVEISGNDFGIDASMARIRLEKARVIDNRAIGINVTDSSSLLVSDSAVTGNEDVGVQVFNNSTLVAQRVDVSGNGSTGVAVRNSSSANIDACTIGNNAQVNPNRSGVFVSMSSSATIDGTEIFGNLTGVGASRHSFITLTGTSIVRDNFREGVRLSLDSGGFVNDPVSIPPNGSGFAVFCNDTESSLENQSTGVGLTNCTGFDSR
jgi:hypothetical protein